MAEKTEKKDKSVGFVVAEVSTKSEPRIYDGEKAYTVEEAMALILNKLDNIEKKIVG